MGNWHNFPFPVNSPAVRKEAARDDICPECGGELDTGWECNDCGFDASDLAYSEVERYLDKPEPEGE